jgi:hypothetical protein
MLHFKAFTIPCSSPTFVNKFDEEWQDWLNADCIQVAELMAIALFRALSEL